MSPSCPHTAGSKSYATDRHAAERCPRFCSQLGLGRGCSGPQIWGNERSRCLLQKSDSIAGSVCGCAVLLKDKDLSRHFTHHGQQFLWQQNIQIIGTINLHSWGQQKSDLWSQALRHRQTPSPTDWTLFAYATDAQPRPASSWWLPERTDGHFADSLVKTPWKLVERATFPIVSNLNMRTFYCILCVICVSFELL